MSDLLRMGYINSLPQPFYVNSGMSKWPVYDIDVETGLMRIDACGMLDVHHISEFNIIIDDSGEEHDVDTFYSDYVEEAEQAK